MFSGTRVEPNNVLRISVDQGVFVRDQGKRNTSDATWSLFFLLVLSMKHEAFDNKF